MRELFVYYRVEPRSADAARHAVLALQQSLRDQIAGLHARWLVRDDTTELQTWMEVYALPRGLDEATQSLIEARAAPMLAHIRGPRHIEAFIDAEAPRVAGVGGATAARPVPD